jgi:uncharacterized protein (UPF0218 family)
LALKLPDVLRERLKAPYGELYRGKGDACVKQVVRNLKDNTKIIAIGDVTTYYLLKAGIVPHMCLVDDMTMRLPVDIEVRMGTAHSSFKDIRVKNPPGLITKELIDAIKDNMGSTMPVRIFVDGEEDLAVIPACIYAPDGSAVIYGQPNAGVVVVMVDEKKRRETAALLASMEETGEQ